MASANGKRTRAVHAEAGDLQHLGRLAPGAQADIAVFDLNGAHLRPIFEPLKNLMLAGRGSDCSASWIAGRPVMEDFVAKGVDMEALRHTADAQYAKLMASHSDRAFDHPPPPRLFQSVYGRR